MPLRTGAARMLFAAPPDVAAAATLLPVGLLFHEPGRFRTGWALVLVGRPVETADCLRLFETAPEEAVRRLTDRLAAALRDLIVEVGDRQTLRLVEEAEAIWLAESPERAARFARSRRVAAAGGGGLPLPRPTRARAHSRAARGARALREGPRGRAASTRAIVSETFPARVVAPLRARPGRGARARLARRPLGSRVPRRAVRADRAGGANRRAPSPTWRRRTSSPPGVVLYPLAWIAEGWAVWRVGGGVALALFAPPLLPGGFFALGWTERLVARGPRRARVAPRPRATAICARHLARAAARDHAGAGRSRGARARAPCSPRARSPRREPARHRRVDALRLRQLGVRRRHLRDDLRRVLRARRGGQRRRRRRSLVGTGGVGLHGAGGRDLALPRAASPTGRACVVPSSSASRRWRWRRPRSWRR